MRRRLFWMRAPRPFMSQKTLPELSRSQSVTSTFLPPRCNSVPLAPAPPSVAVCRKISLWSTMLM